jgi:hypothetical protein
MFSDSHRRSAGEVEEFGHPASPVCFLTVACSAVAHIVDSAVHCVFTFRGKNVGSILSDCGYAEDQASGTEKNANSFSSRITSMILLRSVPSFKHYDPFQIGPYESPGKSCAPRHRWRRRGTPPNRTTPGLLPRPAHRSHSRSGPS